MHLYLHPGIYTYTYTYIPKRKPAPTPTHTYTHTYTHTHSHTHTHTYTYIAGIVESDGHKTLQWPGDVTVRCPETRVVLHWKKRDPEKGRRKFRSAIPEYKMEAETAPPRVDVEQNGPGVANAGPDGLTTSDALAEGLIDLLRPAVEEIDERVRSVRSVNGSMHHHSDCLLWSQDWTSHAPLAALPILCGFPNSFILPSSFITS